MIIDSGPSDYREVGRESNSLSPEMISRGIKKIESHEMRSIEVLSEKGIKRTLAAITRSVTGG
jgi:hypothetical protein